jgi:ABC-type branched-subunit amino acid transport system ATPase component
VTTPTPRSQTTAGKERGSSSYVVETTGLTKRFGGKTVVDHVDLRIPRGVAFGYLGPNGAGKTTLIRMLLGLTAPTAGRISLLGHPVPAEREAALARVGAIVEEPRFHDYLTGRQNLGILAAAREPAATARIDGALRVTLVDGDLQQAAAAVVLTLVTAGLSVYRVESTHPSLEERFLEITSRLEVAA